MRHSSPGKRRSRKGDCRRKVQLPSINPGETGTARFELPDSFRKGDVLELEAFDREGKSICNWTYPIHLAKQYFERNLAQTTLTPAPQKQKPDKRLTPSN